VGKKPISLLASSILKVYKGVVDDVGLATRVVTAHNVRTVLTAAISIICFLFMVITSFEVSIFYDMLFIKLSSFSDNGRGLLILNPLFLILHSEAVKEKSFVNLLFLRHEYAHKRPIVF
jgi:hypothetical protein